MDRVKISNIKEFFKEPSGLALKVVDVERSKEGVFEVVILKASEQPTLLTSTQSNADFDNLVSQSKNIPSYVIEYKVDSSRGLNHYLVKSTIANKRLFVATVQSREEDFNDISIEANSMINSFILIDAES